MCIKREARNNGKRTNLQSGCLLEKKKKKREENALRTFSSAKLFANYCHYHEKEH